MGENQNNKMKLTMGEVNLLSYYTLYSNRTRILPIILLSLTSSLSHRHSMSVILPSKGALKDVQCCFAPCYIKMSAIFSVNSEQSGYQGNSTSSTLIPRFQKPQVTQALAAKNVTFKGPLVKFGVKRLNYTFCLAVWLSVLFTSFTLPIIHLTYFRSSIWRRSDRRAFTHPYANLLAYLLLEKFWKSTKCHLGNQTRQILEIKSII